MTYQTKMASANRTADGTRTSANDRKSVCNKNFGDRSRGSPVVCVLMHWRFWYFLSFL